MWRKLRQQNAGTEQLWQKLWQKLCCPGSVATCDVAKHVIKVRFEPLLPDWLLVRGVWRWWSSMSLYASRTGGRSFHSGSEFLLCLFSL